MSDLTAFDEITASIPRPSIWRAAFAEAEAHLADASPAGVDVLDIARAAWDCLPDEEARDEALDALFYGWWEAEQDRNARTRQAGGAA